MQSHICVQGKLIAANWSVQSIMAGPVQETSPQQQQQATKRYAEADLEPSPVAKRPAEDLEHKHQLQLVDASTNVSLVLIAFWHDGLIVLLLEEMIFGVL